MATYAVLGLVVAPQTVLSLAARGEYSPPNARGSVFVTVAGTKVAFSSAGTALAGLAAGWGARWTLTAGAGIALLSAVLTGHRAARHLVSGARNRTDAATSMTA